jgi:hypothetical protein
VSGTQDWTEYAIVLDVAEEAEEILYGMLMGQDGQVWMSNVCLDEVGQDVPVTDIHAEIAAYYPSNLGFEE